MLSMFKRKESRVVYPGFTQAMQEELQKLVPYTPDAVFLQRRSDYLVFIPDEMMSVHKEHHRLGEDCTKVGLGFTDKKFAFWKQNTEEQTLIPLEKPPHGVPAARIKGEIYLINTPQLYKLDTYRKNGVEFERKRVKILRPMRKAHKLLIKDREAYEWAISKTPFMDELEAFMYVGSPEFWSPLIVPGTKITHTDRRGYKTTARISSSGVFSTVDCFKPNNPALELYYYFRPDVETGSNSS